MWLKPPWLADTALDISVAVTDPILIDNSVSTVELMPDLRLADQVRAHAGAILGMDIRGHTVRRLWVEHASDIAKEYYASFTLDRAAKVVLGGELAEMLRRDLLALQDRGLARLGDRRDRLRQRYSGSDHPRL